MKGVLSDLRPTLRATQERAHLAEQLRAAQQEITRLQCDNALLTTQGAGEGAAWPTIRQAIAKRILTLPPGQAAAVVSTALFVAVSPVAVILGALARALGLFG